jgi:hypothetical protein
MFPFSHISFMTNLFLNHPPPPSAGGGVYVLFPNINSNKKLQAGKKVGKRRRRARKIRSALEGKHFSSGSTCFSGKKIYPVLEAKNMY